MDHEWILSTIRWVAIVPLLSTALAAQSGDQSTIQQAFESQIRVTATTADRLDIVTPGSVVELRKDGLMMYGVFSPLPPSNTYKNGKIGQGWGGFGKDLAISMAAPQGVTAENYPHRQFMAGERCWVTGVTVQKDGVLFNLYSDPFDGIRYYGNLKIPYPNKKVVPPVETALLLVGEVLAVVSADGQNNQENQPQQPSAPGPPQPGASNGDAASSAAPPPAISTGQTREQVTAAYGEPMWKAVVGAKEIYVYQDMKVTFKDGKVSNVQ